MATQTEIAERIESSLRVLLATLEDLPGLAGEWAMLPENARIVEHLDWDHLMVDYLTELDEYYQSGQMTPDQRQRYDLLRCTLKDALPLIEQLNLYRPPVPLER